MLDDIHNAASSLREQYLEYALLGALCQEMWRRGLEMDILRSHTDRSGYPFHPIGKPEKLRTEHLKELRTPTLICQGTRDQFGSMEEVSQYDLSSAIQMSWFEDGDHDLKPRKRVSGFTHADHIQSMGGAVSAWVDGLVG